MSHQDVFVKNRPKLVRSKRVVFHSVRHLCRECGAYVRYGKTGYCHIHAVMHRGDYRFWRVRLFPIMLVDAEMRNWLKIEDLGVCF